MSWSGSGFPACPAELTLERCRNSKVQTLPAERNKLLKIKGLINAKVKIMKRKPEYD
jgi:hypothetical protein